MPSYSFFSHFAFFLKNDFFLPCCLLHFCCFVFRTLFVKTKRTQLVATICCRLNIRIHFLRFFHTSHPRRYLQYPILRLFLLLLNHNFIKLQYKLSNFFARSPFVFRVPQTNYCICFSSSSSSSCFAR